MAQFDFADIAKALDTGSETGVSFEGRSEKWGTAEEVRSLIEEIDKCKELVYLNLDGNTLGVEAAASIGEALKKHPEFKKALWKNMFTGRLKAEIPKALDHLGKGMITAGAQLTVFDCSDNALGPNGMTGLVELFGSSTCYSLQELRLNNCGLGISGGKMLASALLKCHKDSIAAGRPFQLKVFVAGRNRLENEGAKALAKVFAAVKTLEEVAMPQNGIYHEGITALAEAFKLNENMRVLDLNDNTIKPNGATALANVLHCMPKLREIHFAEALVKTQGAIVLADALQDDHVDLEVLNLGYNEIRSNGGYAISFALQNKKKLKSVLLNGNQFGDECCVCLKDRFKNDPGILGSFSDDEGDDEEEEEEEEEEKDDEDGASAEEDETDVSRENGEVSENYGASDENYTAGEDDDVEGVNYITALSDSNIEDQSFVSNKSVSFVGELTRPNTVETFCNTPNPTVKMLVDIDETNKLDAFRNYLKSFSDENYLIALVFTTLKCAALAKESQEALDIAIGLFKDAFDYAVETRQITRVKNFFLIQLGLLKCEDKDFKPVHNLQSCRYALKEALATHSTISPDIKDTLNLFLERFA